MALDRTTEDRLEAIERALGEITRILAPMAEAWKRFGPELERRFDNRISRWKGNARHG